MTKCATMVCCTTVALIASLALDTGTWSLGLASATGTASGSFRFSSAAQDRKTYAERPSSEPGYDSGDDGSREELEDQLDQDDPGDL